MHPITVPRWKTLLRATHSFTAEVCMPCCFVYTPEATEVMGAPELSDLD